MSSFFFFFFSSRRRHTRLQGDWSSDVCSSDLKQNRVRPADPVEQWNNSNAGQRASSEVCAIKAGDVSRLTGKQSGKLQSSYEERHCRSQINFRQIKKVGAS